MPFKNSALFISECLDSILSQTYSNWELLITDDHSTDNSWAIVKKYAQQDLRITFLKNIGDGIIDALKTSFKASSGQFITRMDSDDLMHPLKLELMSKQLLESGKGYVALGLVKYFAENGISVGYLKYQNWLNALTKKGDNFLELYKECVIPSPCWMVHREDLNSCGAFETNRYPEDYDLAFRFYEHHLTCISSNNLLHYWRDYKTRTSRNHHHYAQNHFLELKLYYFLKLHHQPLRPLVLWGAGKKGKIVASSFINENIDFVWICDNPKKIGKHIYNQWMHHFSYLAELENPQCIITVANPEEQMTIRNYLRSNKLQKFKDYFFFC